jgi:putative peptidoglycan lipid II flippase
MIKKLLSKTTKTITGAAIILAMSSIGSGLLGFFRDRMLAGKFGASRELDIYYAAFRIPNLVVAILISGGIIAAFLPVFSEYYHKDQRKAWELTSNTLNTFFLFSIIICGLLFIFAPYLIKWIVPGFNPADRDITVALTRIIFLSPISFCISNIFSSILQYFNRFIAFALAPIFYNLGIIIGIVFFLPRFGLTGLALGVVLGALMHWLIQLPSAIASGFKFKFSFDLHSEGLKRIFILMVPRTFSAVAFHFVLIFITAIASTIGVGNIAVFNFSETLHSFPIGIIGGSFAVAAYPFLARFWARGEKDKFFSSFSSAIRQTLFLIVPISCGLFLLRGPIVRLILGTGRFDWKATRLTAACLGLFAIGIFADAIVPLFQRMFFSLHDTKTPFWISILDLVFNIALSFVFVMVLRHPNFISNFFASILNLKDLNSISVIGLPLSVSVTAIIQFFIYLALLKKKVKELPTKEIWQSTKKILFASLIMSVIVYLAMNIVPSFTNVLSAKGVLIQAAVATIFGVVTYFAVAKILKMPESKSFLNIFIARFKNKDSVIE